MVLAGGGDGTISAVASVLAGSDTALGVLPLGTFNYFARNLGIPLDFQEAARVCLEGELQAVSLGEVNGRVFLNNASLGLYPAMLREREKTYSRWGRSQLLAYVSALLALLRVRRYMQVEVSAAGERRQFRTPLLFAAHNPHQVESFGVAGADCLQGGKLAFYILPPLSRAGMIRVASRMLLRRLEPREDFHLICADTARVESRRAILNVAYDGEIEVMRSPLHFQFRPNALRVIVPRSTPAEAA
jgi:diacylglycerol kinase family enzyme